MNGHHQITIELPQSEIDFVQSFAKQNNTSVDSVIDRLIKSWKFSKKHPVDPGLQKLAGILPSDTDIDTLRMEYLTGKYLRNESND